MTAESFSLNVAQLGESGETVVFLHGLFGQGKNFTQIAKALSPELRSVLLDLPNHGASDWTQRFDYVEQADIVADHLRRTVASEAPVHLVGHSMGGKVAMVLALRHPELISRLAVVDISPVARESMGEFDHLIGTLSRLDLAALSSRGEADELLQEPIPERMVRGFLLQSLLREGERFRWRVNLDLLHESLPQIGGFPEFTDETFEGPVLWVAGAESDYVQDDFAPAMRALFPRVSLTTIKDAGHWVHAEKPEVFSAVLKAFFTAD